MDKVRKIALTAIAVAACFAAFFLPSEKIEPKKDPQSLSSAIANDLRFQKAMKTIIKHEGGLGNNPSDKGSWTNYGISLRYLLNEKMDINGDGAINKEDIIQLTRTKADVIYYRQWYIKNRYDLIEDDVLMTDIMDFSVNVGASQCHKTLRRAINRIINEPLPINGKLDDEVIEVVNLLEPQALHQVFNEEQEKFYRELVKKNPALSVFLKGWFLRSQD